MIRKILFTICIFLALLSFSPTKQSFAAGVPCVSPTGFSCLGGCTAQGKCAPSNKLCEEVAPGVIADIGGDCGSSVIGAIAPPQGVGGYNCSTGLCTNIGIFSFISVALRLFTIVSGLLVFFNFLGAGYTLIAKSGDTKAYSDVRERIMFSLIGLVIIVAAYMIAAMIGLLFFGSATFIIQPDISQYGAV